MPPPLVGGGISQKYVTMDLELLSGTVINGVRYAASLEKPLLVKGVPERIAMHLLARKGRARLYVAPKKKVTKKKAKKVVGDS